MLISQATTVLFCGLVLLDSLFALNIERHMTTQRPETTTRRIHHSQKRRSEKSQENFESFFEENFPTFYRYANSDKKEQSPNLFKEYLIRGQYQCTAKYIEVLTKLNALMKEAFEEHESCLKAMQKPPTYEQTEFDSLNELLDEWKDDDEQESIVESLNTVAPSSQSSSTPKSSSSERSSDIVNVREAQLFV